MQNTDSSALVWLRRDLRLEDNAALAAALQSGARLHCVFVLDSDILDALPRADRRVEFILGTLAGLDAQLRALAGHARAGLIVRHGRAVDEIPQLAAELGVHTVVCAHDYEPQALARDAQVQAALARQRIAWRSVKDHVVFERQEVLTQTGKPYGVFTPYLRAWLARVGEALVPEHDCSALGRALVPRPAALAKPPPSLPDIGFEPTNLQALGILPGAAGAQALLADFAPRMRAYEEARNFPAVKGPSYLGVHLRFGTVSIRQLVNRALPAHRAGDQGASVWLAELVWREFYAQILANFPHVAGASFKSEYDAIVWEQGDIAHSRFAAWCEGRTGYPLVDAAMAQLHQTGYMHNRLRMVAGSFLVKHLGIDWRWGERHFAQHLNDFDLSANNGGWQWVSSSGCDAQPYFRIFNPMSQSEKFDAAGKFIRRYVPALAALDAKHIHAPWLAPALVLQAAGVQLGGNYPHPVVDHATARAATLARYAVVKKAAAPG